MLCAVDGRFKLRSVDCRDQNRRHKMGTIQTPTQFSIIMQPSNGLALVVVVTLRPPVSPGWVVAIIRPSWPVSAGSLIAVGQRAQQVSSVGELKWPAYLSACLPLILVSTSSTTNAVDLSACSASFACQLDVLVLAAARDASQLAKRPSSAAAIMFFIWRLRVSFPA